jgi:hypothetical protein
MTSPVRLLIFGLMRDTNAPELSRLLGREADTGLQMVDIPGNNDEAFAVVKLSPDRDQALRLADRVNHCHFHGRHLQCWVTALPWV